MSLARGVQSSHLTLIDSQEATVNKLSEHGVRGVCCVKQFVARNLFDVLWRRLAVRFVPMREMQVSGEGLLLLQGSCENRHGELHGRFRAKVLSQRHAPHGSRLIVLFRLQSGWQRRLKDIPQRSHIVRGYPLPQLQLFLQQHRFGVNHLKDVARLEVGLLRVCPYRHSRVSLRLSQRYEHTYPHLHLFRHYVRHGVSEDTFEW